MKKLKILEPDDSTQFLEKVLEEISFSASDKSVKKISIDKNYVKKQIGDIYKDIDLTKFIL